MLGQGLVRSAMIQSGTQLAGGLMADRAEEEAEKERQRNMNYRAEVLGVPSPYVGGRY